MSETKDTKTKASQLTGIYLSRILIGVLIPVLGYLMIDKLSTIDSTNSNLNERVRTLELFSAEHGQVDLQIIKKLDLLLLNDTKRSKSEADLYYLNPDLKRPGYVQNTNTGNGSN
jgi:hypothetical protein